MKFIRYEGKQHNIQYKQYTEVLKCTKSQQGWLNLAHSPTLPPPVTAKHRVVKFHEISLSKAQMTKMTVFR